MSKKKILIAGHNGYVGNIIYNYLRPKHQVYGASLHSQPDSNIFKCNFTDLSELHDLAKNVLPDIIIHAAGNKNIGFCENNPQEAFMANTDSLKNIIACFHASVKIIYISTDYVFDGYRGNYPEDYPPLPKTVYGQSKFAAETYGLDNSPNFYVMRLSALFDMNATFPRLIRDTLLEGKKISCFDNIIYSPTYYKDFLVDLDGVIERTDHTRNLFHSCGEPVTRYEFARLFARAFQFDELLVERTTAPAEQTILFPDLSLCSKLSREYLGTQLTTLSNAFYELWSDYNENLQSPQTVRR